MQMQFKSALVVLLFSQILASCVSIISSPSVDSGSGTVDIHRLSVAIEKDKKIDAEFEKRFFDEHIFVSNQGKVDLNFKYLECMAIFESNFIRTINIILPVITLGLIPHKMSYLCPLSIEVKQNNEAIGSYRYNIPVQTIASVYEIFKNKTSTESQLNEERFQYTKKILEEKFNPILMSISFRFNST